MNCYNHPNRPAVATCHVCHKNYCKSCIELSTQPRSEPLCPACLCSNNKAYLADIRMEREASVKSLKTAKILYFPGLVFLPIFFPIGFILMGIPAFKTGLRFAAWVERNNPERIVQTDSGYTKGIWNAGFGTFIFNIVICFLLGVIITPVRMIKLSKTIKQMDAEISNIENTWFFDLDLQDFLAGDHDDDTPLANYNVKCPHCNIELQAPSELIGQEAQCPTCQKTFVVGMP